MSATVLTLFMDLKQTIAFLLHREELFFPLFQEMADHIVDGANLLTDMISQEDDSKKQEETYDRIKEIETQCDTIADQIFDILSNTTFTPFSKADIHDLADKLDSVMDYINAAAKRMILYQPESLTNPTMHMAEIVIECAKAVKQAFMSLPNLHKDAKPILEQCQRLHALEHEGDDVYGDFIIELFDGETDAKELIKLKEIMAEMESATDCTNRVGKTLRTIIVKH